jgi:hypothetical protein
LQVLSIYDGTDQRKIKSGLVGYLLENIAALVNSLSQLRKFITLIVANLGTDAGKFAVKVIPVVK